MLYKTRTFQKAPKRGHKLVHINRIDTERTFLSFFKASARVLCSRSLQDIKLQFGELGYVHGAIVPGLRTKTEKIISSQNRLRTDSDSRIFLQFSSSESVKRWRKGLFCYPCLWKFQEDSKFRRDGFYYGSCSIRTPLTTTMGTTLSLFRLKHNRWAQPQTKNSSQRTKKISQLSVSGLA